jgi:isoaspartyl peptidase/L-asparaginase-like protein (Ntn-hydrolase superfamily)
MFDFLLVSCCSPGDTMEMGSVGFLSRVKDAIGVAYEVYRRTEMTLIAGLGKLDLKIFFLCLFLKNISQL